MSITFTKLPKGIIFDCDGVIIDSFDSNTYFYNSLRKAVGLPEMTKEQRTLVHQMTGAQALKLVIPEQLQEAAQKAYKKIDYVRDIVPLLPINEGLHHLLAYCKEQGIKAAIHTNRIIGMKELLEINSLTEYFNPVMTPNELPAKPDPIGALTICEQWGISHEDAVFIGDSQNDCDTAAAAKIDFIAFKNNSLATDSKAENFKEVEDWLISLS